MVDHIEISSFDLRYEDYRLKSAATERALLTSVLENGIRDPLQGVDVDDHKILLDGFKRYRCAKKLHMEIVPYRSLGGDEVCGIIDLIRFSNVKSLSILEQARLIDELKRGHQMSHSDIAGLLEKSKSWVSMRCGIMSEMSETVKKEVFGGRFPVYSFMYTLRRFIRMNTINKSEIDEFVRSVSGKRLSIRDIGLLANGYFKGPDEFRAQIKTGNLSWGLERLKHHTAIAKGLSEREKTILKTLEIILRYMQRFMAQHDALSMSNAFAAQANMLSSGMIELFDAFKTAMEAFHDSTEQT
ncbi:MAG: chromosome partitioning protein ParB [Deltaproteobacteria bacterium]|nr:chromosome partitioning protein ParB [Deltaproteobacteria bacterium]